MSAFNAQFVENSSIEFFTLTEVTLPGPVPRGMRYKSELCTAVYKDHHSRDTSNEEIEWYRRTISPSINMDNREHNIKVFINTLCVFKPSHYLFKWILKLTNILDDYVPKYGFAVRIGSKYYNPVCKHDNGSMFIRHTIDSMYKYNILTTFCMTTKSSYYGRSYRSCYHGDFPNNRGPDKCFWCYLRENGELPYGVYLFDTMEIFQSNGGGTNKIVGIECVIYDINPEVIDWFVNLERFYRLKIIYFDRLMDYREYYSDKQCLLLSYHNLYNPHAYLTPERLSLLIKLMKEDSHLLDKIYGIPSCELVSETIIDVPPIDKSSTEIQTEPSKGLISRIFGL